MKPAVRFRQETIAAIDPATRIVITDAGTYEADILVVALGADYDIDATPVPPSPETSRALLEAFAERNIAFEGERDGGRLHPGQSADACDDFPRGVCLRRLREARNPESRDVREGAARAQPPCPLVRPVIPR